MIIKRNININIFIIRHNPNTNRKSTGGQARTGPIKQSISARFFIFLIAKTSVVFKHLNDALLLIVD